MSKNYTIPPYHYTINPQGRSIVAHGGLLSPSIGAKIGGWRVCDYRNHPVRADESSLYPDNGRQRRICSTCVTDWACDLYEEQQEQWALDCLIRQEMGY